MSGEGLNMSKITKRDRDVLEFIKSYMGERGYTPTIREIGEGVGLFSTASVYMHFRNLCEAGYITQVSDGKGCRYIVKGMRYIEDGR